MHLKKKKQVNIKLISILIFCYYIFVIIKEIVYNLGFQALKIRGK